jgi:hypothetical protein
MQWVQDPNQSNANILNNVKRENSKHSGNKKKVHLETNIVEL